MPELPEVETMRRGIACCIGSRIAAVEKPRCRLRPIQITPRLPTLRRRAVGQEIAAVDRVGKRVVVRLQSDDALIFEPRMTGLLLLADPPDEEHLRLRIALAGRTGPEKLLFWDRRGLGSVRLLNPAAFAKIFGPDHLGPDALEISTDVLRQQLADSQREIKVALLDQRAVAGIGNLYAAEILFVAGIHPQKQCRRLSADEWQNLHQATRRVLKAAIRYEGSTLGDGTYRNALNRKGRYQNHHRVYKRAGERCSGCGKGTITRIVQAQRATFFCPVCQRKTKPRKPK